MLAYAVMPGERIFLYLGRRRLNCTGSLMGESTESAASASSKECLE